MIRTFNYCNTCHATLHDSIIAFFDRIEFETGDFDENFFDEQLRDLAGRHKKILKSRLESIYNEFRKWEQSKRTELCEEIRKSNDIAAVCNGHYKPRVMDNTAKGIDKLLRDLFLDLYKQVLDGNAFNERHDTSLKRHFLAFRRANKEITLCPICGISELKMHTDDTRDQYDHYLPESKYPFSAINFQNLVPGCTECNSPQIKGSKDVVAISKGRLFYPYDGTHKGISIEVDVSKDHEDIEEVKWKMTYSNPDGKSNEIKAWKSIYEIDSRYIGYLRARIPKWYKTRFEAKQNSIKKGVKEDQFNIVYNEVLNADKENHLNFIRKPALDGFIQGSVLAQAELEAKQYSN